MAKILLATLIGIIISCSFAPKFAYSQIETGKSGSLEASPAFVEVVVDKPDDSKQVVLTYINHSQNPITLEMFPIDFKQADGSGNISFLGRESGSFSYSLSSFLSFESNSLQLEPGEKKEFAVTIQNRQDLSPGGHYAAVVAKQNIEGDSSDGQARVAPSVSSFILLRKVGGERFNLSLVDMDFPQNGVSFDYPRSITANFQNEGNVHLVPYGIVEIKDMFGRLIYKGVINTSSLRILPETRRYISVDMQKTDWSLPLSINSLTVEGNDSLSKVKYSFKANFVYINPIFVGILITTAIGILVLRKRTKKK